jgi:quinoprotein dehydrogenase-associated probable ABC transporter substrate-binding protein
VEQQVNINSLALGAHPQRELTPMPHLGFARPRLGMAAGACLSLALLGAAVAGSPVPPLKVCADPYNLPASNEKFEGFENKIAALVARDLGTSVSYVWWGQRRGFVRNTMNATLKEGRCEVMIGVPQGYDLVRTTKPYYRSTYVFVYPKAKGWHLNSLDDPRLKTAKIGVHLLGEDYSNPPPVHALATRGVVSNVVGFDTFYSDQNPPNRIIDALASGKIDVAIVWGPAVSNFVVHQQVPMEMVPVPSGKTDLPFAFDISMGVRPGNEALRMQLEAVIDRKRAEITQILKDYGVPLVPRKVDSK